MPDPNLIILLVATPLAAAIVTSLVRVWIPLQRLAGVVSLLFCIAVSAGLLWSVKDGGMLVAQAGGWPAPFGISVCFDALSGSLLLAANVVALACYVHSFGSLPRRSVRGWYHPLLHLVVMGVNYSLITGDLFNLFVAFEVMLLASYALLCVGASREQLAQAYKYVMLNLIGSTIFVLGAGLVYGMMGTLNFADLAVMVSSMDAEEGLPTGFRAVAMMLLFVFALKAAVFPLWFWLPDTYPTCPIAICALFGGLLTKVGVYALFRTFPMIFAAPGIREGSGFPTILATVAIASLLIAILAAIGMRNIRRVLTLTLLSHIGYFAFGAAVMTTTAFAGAVFYMIQHMLVMTALFLCCGVIEAKTGTDDLARSGGLLKRAPWLAVFFFIAAISLAGLPPTSGFYGKLLLIKEGFAASADGMWMLSVAGLLTTLLTLVAMAKIWTRVFWSEAPAADSAGPDAKRRTPGPAGLAPMYASAATLVSASALMAIFAEPMMQVAYAAARPLNEPRMYVVAVLGEDAWPRSAPRPELGDAGPQGPAEVETALIREEESQ